MRGELNFKKRDAERPIRTFEPSMVSAKYGVSQVWRQASMVSGNSMKL